MHDLSLGGPVDIGRVDGVNHEGNCNDGVYGCTKCHNSANEGWGTTMECDWCHKETFTLIVRAWDEPVLYALCKDCIVKNKSDEPDYELIDYDEDMDSDPYQDFLDEEDQRARDAEPEDDRCDKHKEWNCKECD